jgi:hypothetical protein
MESHSSVAPSLSSKPIKRDPTIETILFERDQVNIHKYENESERISYV